MGILQRVRAQHNTLTMRTKATSYKPELAGRVHIMSGPADDIPAMDDFSDYASVYGVYPWVRKAVAKIAENFAPLPVRVIDEDGKEVEGHPVTEAFLNVNGATSPSQMWQQWVIHMMLGGEEFIQIVPDSRGQPTELWTRRPDWVSVIPDASDEGKLYPRVVGYRFFDKEERMGLDVDPEDMIFFKFFNPSSKWRGIAPITALREGIAIDLFSQAWSKSFLRTGARPDFAVIAPQGVTATEREEIETRLMLNFSGEKGWHRPIVLEEGVTDIKPFSWAPKDLEWLQQRMFSRDEVAAVFGVPDEIMGYGRDTYENFSTALSVFWSLTLAPLIDLRDDTLTHYFSKVRPILAPGQTVATDVSGVDSLQEDMKPKVEMALALYSMGVPFDIIDDRLGLGIGELPNDGTDEVPEDEQVVEDGDPAEEPEEEDVQRSAEKWAEIAQFRYP